MNVKYCLPIIKKTIEEVEEVIEKNKKLYSLFEIWGGHLRRFTTDEEEKIFNLSDKLKGKLILVMRNKSDDMYHLTNFEQDMMLSCFLYSGEIVDIDISQKDLLKNILIKETSNPNLLLSYHNYIETPSNEALETVVSEMHQYKPSIYKISTLCRSEEDAIRLLILQQKFKQQNLKHIVLGMGEYGKITRIFGTIWGNEMIYAPIDKSESSAPGQLTKSELEQIFKIINNK